MAGRMATLALAAVLVPAAAALAEEKAGDPVVFKEKGQASYYSDKFQGKETASGEKFDQNKPVAAHPELPLGSEATVRNPETGEEIEVQVVDRGPFVKDREIDLSKSAAREIGIDAEKGVAEVEIEATKEQVEQAIDDPDKAGKVKRKLQEARQAAAQDGTPQPKPLPELDAPAGGEGEKAAKDG